MAFTSSRMEKRKVGIWEMEERISKNYHFKPQVYKELEKWEQKAEKLKWQAGIQGSSN